LIAFSNPDLEGKAGIIFEFGKKFLWKANWNATSDTLVKKGRAVQIIAVEGLTTKVKPET